MPDFVVGGKTLQARVIDLDRDHLRTRSRSAHAGRWDTSGTGGLDPNALGSAWFDEQLRHRGLTIDRVYAWEYEVLSITSSNGG
jgi:hypothetical protein